MARKKSEKEIDVISAELDNLLKQEADTDNGDAAEKKKNKAILAVIIAVVLTVVIGIGAPYIYFQMQGPISFGPNALESEMTPEKIEKHEENLKKLDEQKAPQEGLYFIGYYARFDKEGDLVVDGYMRNFTGHEVYDITGNITVSTKGGDNVGGAYFEFPEKEFGSLKNGKSRPWRIEIKNDLVNVEITDLSSFKILTQFDFHQK